VAWHFRGLLRRKRPGPPPCELPGPEGAEPVPPAVAVSPTPGRGQ
jgi:hypothetical protein